jgi:ribosomal protein L37AE/L43A
MADLVGRHVPVSDPSAWLVLAVGANRQHGGNSGYDDDPASHYSWDDTVPHHADVLVGDRIVIWDKQRLLGVSVIDRVETGAAVKHVFRCPVCGTAQIKARRSKRPLYRCFRCHSEFDQATAIETPVITYRSHHDAGWQELSGVIAPATLRAMCVKPKSQLSLRPLRWQEFTAAVAAVRPDLPLDNVETRAWQLEGGHREKTVRVRLGQAAFREALIAEFGSNCAFTGPTPESAIEACHLYSYAADGRHNVSGGLLLRRDLHRLFDLGLLAVDPGSLTIHTADTLAEFPAYADLNGQRLWIAVDDRRRAWLRRHWRQHRASPEMRHTS